MIFIHNFNPIIFQIGSIKLHWYGFMYVLAFLFAYFFLRQKSKATDKQQSKLTFEQIDILLFSIFLGVILGGRLGYFLFYNPRIFLNDFFEIFRVWHGGMSFHGGLLGVIIVSIWFSKKFKISLLALGDLIVIPVTVGLFLGRIGNFINGELYGRLTDGTWGVIFPLASDNLPRHPSQLYEAGKNLLILGALWFFSCNKIQSQPAGFLGFVFLILYGVGRFLIEQFWRQPVDGYILGLTTGQFWSVPVAVVGVIGLIALKIGEKNKEKKI